MTDGAATAELALELAAELARVREERDVAVRNERAHAVHLQRCIEERLQLTKRLEATRLELEGALEELYRLKVSTTVEATTLRMQAERAKKGQG